MPSRLPAVLAVVVGLLALTVPAAGASTGPGVAKAKPGAPGSLTGYGFDACSAPPQAVMDAWWEQSPYSAVGIYIGGSNRLCKDQPELTAGWVRTQQRTGWHLLPVQVGPQASCSGYADRMSSDLATAKQQGSAEAATAIATARGLGIGSGSTLYYDLEDYDLAPDDCRRAALSFLSGWTEALHGAGYDSGVYSNIAAAITSLDLADRADPTAYTMPDDIWFAWANGTGRHRHRRARAQRRVERPRPGPPVRPRRTADLRRLHPHDRRQLARRRQGFGRVAVAAAVPWRRRGPAEVPHAAPGLARTRGRGGAVRPAQAGADEGTAQRALRQADRRRGEEGAAEAGPEADREDHPQDLGGAAGPRAAPLLKVGSTGDPVRRLQRALTAALGKRVKVDGAVSKATERAVRKYQRKSHLPETGVVTDEVWERLRSGR